MMESETGSSADEHHQHQQQLHRGDVAVAVAVAAAADTRGKHRVLAQLKRLDQEINSLQEELEELDRTDSVSTVCQELVRNIEKIPDPLLSETQGPANPSWDRWFEGPQEAKGCRCWIL